MVRIEKTITQILILLTISFGLELKINNNIFLNHNLKIYIPIDELTPTTYRLSYRYMDITLRPLYFGFTIHDYYNLKKETILYLNSGIKINF